MNFDTELASRLRATIVDVDAQVRKHADGPLPAVRDLYIEHLTYLLKQEKFLFTGMVVSDAPELTAVETPPPPPPMADGFDTHCAARKTPWYPPGYAWIVLGGSCNTRPVPPGTPVHTLTRREQGERRFSDKVMFAGSFEWSRHVTNPIVAYAIAETKA